MPAVLPIFDFSLFWIGGFTQKQPVESTRLVMTRPERLIEMIEADYAIYADLCAESDRAPNKTPLEKAWIEQALSRLVESAVQPWLSEPWNPPNALRLLKPIAQDPDAVISPPAAQ